MRPSKRDAARRVVLYVMRRGIVRASTRYARHRPYQAAMGNRAN